MANRGYNDLTLNNKYSFLTHSLGVGTCAYSYLYYTLGKPINIKAITNSIDMIIPKNNM